MTPDQISRTAAFIAIKFYGLTRMEPYCNWFNEDILLFYDRLVKFLPQPLNWYHSILQKKWARQFFIFAEELLLPGDLMHIITRKYFINKKVHKLLSGEYDQLLVLGAGFDHLSVIHSQDGTPCFEIDAPGTTSIKNNFLDFSGYRNKRLHTMEYFYDHNKPALPMRRIDGLNADLNTIIIAEGFFDYLNPDGVRKILEDLSLFFKNKTKMISTVFVLNELTFLRRWIFRSSVWLAGERIQLDLSKEAFINSLQSVGFSIENIMVGEYMKDQLLSPHEIGLPVLDGFYLMSSVREKNIELWNT